MFLKHGACKNPLTGKRETAEYRAWGHIKSRCLNPKVKDYPDYGGRGVRLCVRWQVSFSAFLQDVGSRPSPAHSIERVDHNGHYEPGNVVWATRLTQNRNKRSNVMVDLEGRRVCLSEACEHYGLRYGTVVQRLNVYGWSIDRALERE